jgi:GWxTD domain-containing protein
MRGVSAAQAAVSVVFWRGARAQIALQIRQTMVFKNGEAQWQLNLPAGAYRVAISIGNQAFSRTYTVPQSIPQGSISDVFLAYSSAKQTHETLFLTGKNLQFSDEISPTRRLYWAISLRASAANQLSLRVILYRKSAKTRENIGAYASVWQRSYVPSAASNTWLSDSLPMAQLTEGEYLLEVMAYQGKTRLLERSTAFFVPWKGFAQLYADVPTAIRMMRWAWKSATLDSVLRLPATRQRAAFDQLWQKRFPQQPQQAMQRYFSAVFIANTRFRSGNMAGWQTERGGAYIRFGEPDAIERLPQGERWLYKKWGGNFLFN